MKKRGDFFGNTVQLAAHLCDHAEADQILIADEVHSLCRSLEISFADLGEITPKGFETAVRVYTVDWR